MADVKLVYFNGPGRGEFSRLILAYAGVDFEDHRIPFPGGEVWAKLKPTLPYNSMPVLYYNGKEICQSVTIARFLANEFGLAGANNMERAEADEAVDALIDIMNAGYPSFFGRNDPNQGPQLIAKFKPIQDKGFENLEKRLVARGGQFLAGNKLSWADLKLFDLVHWLGVIGCLDLDQYPGLKDLARRVGELPNIKAWNMKKNPDRVPK